MTTRGDAGAATAGAGIAIAIVDFDTDAYLDTTGDVAAASLLVRADSTDTVTTTAGASQGGATANDESPMDRTEGNAQTSDGSLALAGALAFTKLDSHTTAVVGGAAPVSVTTTGEQRISAESGHSSTATADGEAAAEGDPGVGIAIAIALSDVSAEAFVAGVADLSASSLVIQAVNESGATYVVTATAGASPATGTVVTGALAFHLLMSKTRAVLPAGSTVTVGGADVSLTATSENASTVKALPAGMSTSTTGDLGIGAAFALHIVNDETTAALENTSALLGADALSLAATSTDAMITEAQAGASADTAIVPAVAISISNVSTNATIGTGDELEIGGALLAQAAQTATVDTFAKGLAEGGEGAGVAIALTFADHRVIATTDRSLTAGGAVTFTARGYSLSAARAVASIAGGPDTASEPVDGQVAEQRSFADGRAAANGASGAETADTPSSDTSEGSISVAAAIAVNLVNAVVLALLPDGVSVTSGGLLTLSALGESDAEASADGTAVTSSTDADVIGAGVAINLAFVRTEASVGALGIILSLGLALSAQTGGLAGAGADGSNTFKAAAASGAGGGDVGVAGAFALNLVDLKTLALLRYEAAHGPPTVNANNGAVTLSAISTSTSTASALPKPSGASASLGIGASVALNIVNDTAEAALQGPSVLTGATDLTLRAKAEHAMTTAAENGAKSSSPTGDAVTPVVAVAISLISSSATIGALPGGSLSVTGAINVKAELTASAVTSAKGSAEAADAAVGVAIALTYAEHRTLATSLRDLLAGGDVMFEAIGASAASSTATASAVGAPGEDEPDAPADGVDGQIAGERSHANGVAAANGTSGSTGLPEDPAAESSEQDSSGDSTPLQVAAAIAVTVAVSDQDASLPAGIVVGSSSAGVGVVTLRARGNSDSAASASGQAVTTGASTGDTVGAAVGLNLAFATTKAGLGGSSQLFGKSLLVEAGTNVRDADGDPATAADDAHVFGAEATSGAGGGKNSVAGSLAFNLVLISATASVGDSSVLTFAGGTGDLTVTAGSKSVSTVKALPGTEAGASGEAFGLGLSIGLSIVVDDTLARLGDGVATSGAHDVVLTAAGGHVMTTEAANGAATTAAGSDAVTPVIAVSVSLVTSQALIGSGGSAGRWRRAGRSRRGPRRWRR